MAAISKNNSMKVEVAYPECVHIELVQSNDLRNYEVFGALASLFAAAAVGFWVSYLTTAQSSVLFWVSLVLSLMTLAFVFCVWHFRSKMHGEKITKQVTIK